MTYSDGASALEDFKTNAPDLAILDIKMPRMDGMELLHSVYCIAQIDISYSMRLIEPFVLQLLHSPRVYESTR